MPKIKTHKATSKRFSKTPSGKLIRRKSGQDHFNAKQKGKTMRNKRRDILAKGQDVKNFTKVMPYV